MERRSEEGKRGGEETRGRDERGKEGRGGVWV